MSRKFEMDQAYKDKSILSYQLDSNQWVNDKQCRMVNPTFLAYIPTGVLPHSIAVEDELRDQTRILSNCPSDKYKGNPDLASNGLSRQVQHYFPHQREACPPGFEIVQSYTGMDSDRSRIKDALEPIAGVQYAEYQNTVPSTLKYTQQ